MSILYPELMNKVYHVHMDDILIMGKAFEGHLENGARVLTDYMKQVNVNQVQYLKHTISDQRILPNANKAKAI